MIKNPWTYCIGNQSEWHHNCREIWYNNTTPGMHFSNMAHYFKCGILDQKRCRLEGLLSGTSLLPNMDQQCHLALEKGLYRCVEHLKQQQSGIRLDIDVVGLITSFSNPADIETLINDVALCFATQTIERGSGKYTKELMIPGLPDYMSDS